MSLNLLIQTITMSEKKRDLNERRTEMHYFMDDYIFTLFIRFMGDVKMNKNRKDTLDWLILCLIILFFILIAMIQAIKGW